MINPPYFPLLGKKDTKKTLHLLLISLSKNLLSSLAMQIDERIWAVSTSFHNPSLCPGWDLNLSREPKAPPRQQRISRSLQRWDRLPGRRRQFSILSLLALRCHLLLVPSMIKHVFLNLTHNTIFLLKLNFVPLSVSRSLQGVSFYCYFLFLARCRWWRAGRRGTWGSASTSPTSSSPSSVSSSSSSSLRQDSLAPVCHNLLFSSC